MTQPLRGSERKGKASKLRGEDVRTIRQVLAEGTQSTKEMARFYGVGVETIRRAARGDTWTELPPAPTAETIQQIDEAAAASMRKMQAMLAAEHARLAIPAQAIADLTETPTLADRMKDYDWIKKGA